MTSKKPMRVIFTRPSEIITRLSPIPTAKSRFGDSKQFNTHVPCRTLLWLSPYCFPSPKCFPTLISPENSGFQSINGYKVVTRPSKLLPRDPLAIENYLHPCIISEIINAITKSIKQPMHPFWASLIASPVVRPQSEQRPSMCNLLH